MNNYEFFACSAQLKVGNGQRIRLCEDPWMNNRPLKEAFPNLCRIACQTGITLSTVWTSSGRNSQWNMEFRWNLCEEVNAFPQFSQLLDGTTLIDGKGDLKNCRWGRTGNFSVKSAIRVLCKEVRGFLGTRGFGTRNSLSKC